VIFTQPVADWTKNGVVKGVEPAAIFGLIKFLFAPVSTRNCNLAPSLVSYSKYGTLERRPS